MCFLSAAMLPMPSSSRVNLHCGQPAGVTKVQIMPGSDDAPALVRKMKELVA